jgi:hypothetical protein
MIRMKNLRSLLIASILTSALLSCNSNQEPTQKTGQGDGISTIDSTKSEEQMDGTKAPGYSEDSTEAKGQ